MYTEDYENRGFPFRDFLLKLILIIIFVFLLVWLLPKFITPAINKNIKNGSSTEINALSSQIFADNLEKMKQAAISYYTDERLPQKEGEYKQMTLSEMIGLKLLTPLIDKNNKAVDVEGSYVKITKAEDEYILKVNLKDSEKEDYILVHLGCYTYCKSNICEKEPTNVSVKGEKPNTTTKKYYCEIQNGKYYSKNGTVVDKNRYEEECITKPTEEKHYCQIVNGKYYGKVGNVVDKETYENECTTTPPVEEKHYCQIVNGKYYDKAGNVVSKEDYEKSCTIKPNEYLYEYARTTNATFSEWSKWNSYVKTSCDTKAITCNKDDITCLAELKLYERKEKIGTYEKKYVKDREVQIKSDAYQQKTCTNYNYVIISNKTYVVSTTYTNVSTITSETASSIAGWTYNGRKLYSNPPRDTETKHYVFVGADYSYCTDTCTTLPNFYYDEYTYNGTISEVTSTTTTPVKEGTDVEASCGGYVTKVVYTYGYIKSSEIATRTEPLYGTVCYKSERTRKLTSEGKTEKKWSYYNDTNLLNNNWYYTGAKKLK